MHIFLPPRGKSEINVTPALHVKVLKQADSSSIYSLTIMFYGKAKNSVPLPAFSLLSSITVSCSWKGSGRVNAHPCLSVWVCERLPAR